MKHLWKRMTALLLSLGICTGTMALPAAAWTEDATDNAYLCDEAGALLDEEFESAMAQIRQTADYTGMNVAVYIGGEPLGSGESSTIRFCDDHYDDLFGINTDGVFLYIDMSGESDLFDYLSTSGLGQFYYTNAEADDRVGSIIANLENWLPRGAENVPNAISTFCDDLQYYYDRGIPDNYYVYNSSNGEYMYYENGQIHYVDDYDDLPADYTAAASWGMIFLAAAVVGLIVFGISLLVIRQRYRFKQAGNMRSYMKMDSIRITNRTDRFLRQYRTRTKLSSEGGGHGGGGGGHSHSSGGGGSHGGGGGHR